MQGACNSWSARGKNYCINTYIWIVRAFTLTVSCLLLHSYDYSKQHQINLQFNCLIISEHSAPAVQRHAPHGFSCEKVLFRPIVRLFDFHQSPITYQSYAETDLMVKTMSRAVGETRAVAKQLPSFWSAAFSKRTPSRPRSWSQTCKSRWSGPCLWPWRG